MVVGQVGCALIDKATLSQHIEINGDSISASVPTEKMILIFTPETLNINSERKIEINLRQTILNAIDNSLDAFISV